MYTAHTTCRACNYGQRPAPGTKAANPQDLLPVFSLGAQPLANDFCREDDSRAGFAPLTILHCPRCTLAQLSVVVDPEILYWNYSYITSPGASLQQHLQNLFADLDGQVSRGTLIEIGSNDGTVLQSCMENGWQRVCGIDPASNLTEIAKQKGLPTVTGLFDDTSAEAAVLKVGRADLVLARHVFCHIHDWRGFIRSLSCLCHKDSIVCIEVPYVENFLARCEFDTVYHEHLSYFGLRPMAALLEGTPFHMHKVQMYPIHGGAICVTLRSNTSEIPPHPSVQQWLDAEDATPERWKQFSVRAHTRIETLRSTIRGLRAQGKRVCGYGASAKSTVWINAMGLTRADLYGVYDNTPQKQWTFIPGTDIPVIHEGAFYADAADYAVLFAWNWKAEVMEKQSKWAAGGGKWIVPVPEVEVI